MFQKGRLHFAMVFFTMAACGSTLLHCRRRPPAERLPANPQATAERKAGTQPAPLSEAEKIERLIAAIENSKELVFVRNGVEHSATEAADHLRRKWQAKKREITKARQFVAELAGKSWLTGQPYQVRWPDGRVETSEAFLRKVLQELEAEGGEDARN